MLMTNSTQAPTPTCENPRTHNSADYTEGPTLLSSPWCAERAPWSERLTSRCGSAASCTQPGQRTAAKAPGPRTGQPRSCKPSQDTQSSACYGKTCMLTFLLAKDICIYHPLLNEPHLSTIDHSYPSIIKTNILQISYVSASLHLRFCLVPIF